MRLRFWKRKRRLPTDAEIAAQLSRIEADAALRSALLGLGVALAVALVDWYDRRGSAGP